MELNFKNLENIKKLEEMYEEIFKREGMGKFMQLAWKNVRDEYTEEPYILDLCIRLMIEECLVYIIAVNKENVYEKVKTLKEVQKLNIKIKPYEEVEKYYQFYISEIRRYLSQNPDSFKLSLD